MSSCSLHVMRKHIFSLSKSCFYHIRDLRRIRSTLDFDTARTIATSLVHSKLDYCNSLYYNLPHVQIGRLQVIQNALARAVTNISKFVHITPILNTTNRLKIRQRMEYKIIGLSLTYTALQLTTWATFFFICSPHLWNSLTNCLLSALSQVQ